jgi:hypothetical protein
MALLVLQWPSGEPKCHKHQGGEALQYPTQSSDSNCAKVVENVTDWFKTLGALKDFLWQCRSKA